MNKLRSLQKGFASIVFMAIITAMIGGAAIFFEKIRRTNLENQKAEMAGTHLREHVFGVMRYISERGTSTPAGTYTGSLWLKKASTCTGATGTESYITNCAFPELNSYGNAYTTVVSVSGGVVTAVVRVKWPKDYNYVTASDLATGNASALAYLNGRLAAIVKNTAASYLSSATPVAQTFVDYTLDQTNKDIVATISTASSTDIWLRSDGSNKMNANLNMGGRSIYNVLNLYGASTAVNSTATTISVGSALNTSGIVTIGRNPSGGTEAGSYLSVLGKDPSGYSINAAGNISAAGGTVALGGAGITNPTVLFNANGTRSVIRASGNDIIIGSPDSAGAGTLVADKVYSPNVNRYTDQAVYNVTILDYDSNNPPTITKPNCTFTGASLTPQIFLSFAGVSTAVLESGNGDNMKAMDVWAENLGSSWRVRVKLFTNADDYGGHIKAKILAIIKCS